MKKLLHRAALAASMLALVGLTGCSTPETNPPVPRAQTGYIDFYTDADLGLSWEVKRSDDRNGEMRTVYSEFEPVQGTVLRLAGPPGNHQFQVWFMNLVTKGPQSVNVQVADGKVTPVHVTLSSSGTASIDSKVPGFYSSARGYTRGTRTFSSESEVYTIGAVAEAPQTYQPKERMPYWSLTAK